MSQLDIKIRKLQDNGSTFRANIETLYLGGVRSAKVDRLHFEVPEEWKACTISLHVKRLSGTLPDPQILDENNSALVDRRWTLEKEGTWMLLAINDSGYIAMTKPGKYTCYDTIDTDTTTENITPSIYEQFVAEVTKYAKQALESMNAAKTSETNAKTSETNAKASADKAKASADSMDASVATCTTKAGEAEASAAGAKTSETKAKTSETNAKASENAAKTSETNAKTSETNAKSSETKAATSAANAKTSETNAKASADSMGASVATCTAKAKEAEASAGKAKTSEGNAKTSEGNAKASENEARQLVEAAKKVVNTDKTLTIDGAPADAKIVGDKFKSIKTDWNSVTDKPSTFPSTWDNVSGKPSVYPTNWDNVSGKPSSYPPSAHGHYYLADEGDNRSTATTPDTYNNFPNSPHGGIAFRGLKYCTTIGLNSGATYAYLLGLRGWGDSYGGNAHEIAFTDSGIYVRNGSTTSWGSWNKLNTNTITSQTSDPGAGSSLATGSILLVYA